MGEQKRCVNDTHIRQRNLVDPIAVAVEDKVLDRVAGIATGRLPHDEECVEEVGIVLFVIDDSVICGMVSLAKGGEPVAMVRVPVTQMLDVRMFLFNLFCR